MPPIERALRQRRAVLWAATGVPDAYGRPLLSDPIEIRVRWENKRVEVKDAKGNTVNLDAAVVVDRVIKPGSNMWLGALDDLPGTSFTNEDEELMVVITFDRVPDDKGRNHRMEVGLKRFRDYPT